MMYFFFTAVAAVSFLLGMLCGVKQTLKSVKRLMEKMREDLMNGNP